MATLMVKIDGLAPHECKELVEFFVVERATIFRKEEPWGDNNIKIDMPNNISVLATTDNIIFFSSNNVIAIPTNSFERLVII